MINDKSRIKELTIDIFANMSSDVKSSAVNAENQSQSEKRDERISNHLN